MQILNTKNVCVYHSHTLLAYTEEWKQQTKTPSQDKVEKERKKKKVADLVVKMNKYMLYRKKKGFLFLAL